MNIKKWFYVFLGLSCTGIANASLIKITASSDAAGELGWFAVDDSIFTTDTSLVASQFYDFYWYEDGISVKFTPLDVSTDTGTTNFGFIGGKWTVIGGTGDSLTHDEGYTMSITGSTYIEFVDLGVSSYSDVTWSTTAYSAVPVPAAVWLFGSGLFGLLWVARRNKT